MDLFPLNFEEFLRALNQQALLDLIIKKDWALIKSFKSKLIQYLRSYYYIGGMPETVLSYCEDNDFRKVRTIQKRLLEAYEKDFSKHAPYDVVPRIRMLWNSIPSQLAKENRKFIYKAVKPGSRAKDYEMALSWLIDCGLIHKVNRVSKPGIPLKAYEDFHALKLFMTDVGLIGAMGDLDVRTLLEGNSIFSEFKGALTEQFVLQQLKAIPDITIYYWSAEKSKSEIDFLIQYSGEIIPVEVKSVENLQAKSLRTYCQKYEPNTAIRTSMSDFRKEDWMTNLPLYAISKITEL